MSNKQLIIGMILTYALFLSIGYVGANAFMAKGRTTNTVSTTTADAVTPTPSEPLTEECPLNGKMYGAKAKAKWEKRRPLAVVIENHLESRPQSGISQSDVTYEAVSEGGVTRTLSIFYCQDAKTVGPVRSARVHFINLLREWGNAPLYAHVGGANCDKTTGSGCGNGAPADALGLISRLGWNLYNDLNQFAIPFPYYYRDYDRLPGVATEHTMYSSTAKLWEYAAKNRQLTEVDEDGIRWDKGWEPWTFVDDDPEAKRGDVAYIKYDFYDVNVHEYGVVWEYDKKTNTYKRFNGGQPHKDYNTNTQLTAKNLIVIEAIETAANDDYPGGHVVYKLVGSGNAYIYQNGREIKGTWTKDDADAKMIFEDEDGKEISIVRGQVWLSMLPKGNEIYAGKAAPTKVPGASEKKVPASTKSSPSKTQTTEAE